MKNRLLLTFRDTWDLFKGGTLVRPSQYSLYEAGYPNCVDFTELFTNTTFSGLSQYSYPIILGGYPFFEKVNNAWKQKAHLSDLVNTLWATHSESFCCFCDYEEDATSSEILDIEKDRVKKFYGTLFSILDDTWDKYDMMLSIYDEKKAHLLDAIKTIVAGDSSRTIEGESSGSRSGTSSGETSNTSTTTYNTSDDITINDDTSGQDVSAIEYDSEVANSRTNSIENVVNTKAQDTPQVGLGVDSGYDSERGYSTNDTDESSSSTDTRTGTDTTTNSYGKEIDRTEVHTKTGTEGVVAGGTSSTEDSETTSGSTSTTETGDTSSTTEEDRDTLMARIDEIDNKYKMLLKAWCNEFKALFWEVLDNEE